MPQELRSILFTEDEVRQAVSRLLLSRVRGLRPHQIGHVSVCVDDGAVHAIARLSTEQGGERSLDPYELMTAILMYCRGTGIPLANRSQKRLGVIDGCLSLTTSLNPRRIDPWVAGDRVLHAVSDPLLLAHHVG